MKINQTREAISVGNFIFPAQWLLDRKFPPLPEGIVNRHYDPSKNLFSQSDGESQYSAGSLPWKEGEAFLNKAETLFKEYKSETLPQVDEPQNDSQTEAVFNYIDFLFEVQTSLFYKIAKGLAKIYEAVNWEFQEVNKLFLTPLIIDPRILVVGGLLQENLEELLQEIYGLTVDGELETAILNFNAILKKHLKIDWELVV